MTTLHIITMQIMDGKRLNPEVKAAFATRGELEDFRMQAKAKGWSTRRMTPESGLTSTTVEDALAALDAQIEELEPVEE